MTSPSKASPTAELQPLRSRIETALDQRGRHYSNYFTFAFRFEADDTAAEKDTANFQTILELLGLPQAVELVIKAGDKTPRWRIIGFIGEMFQSQVINSGRTLLIGHYAGHGGVIEKDQLYFVSGPPSPLRVLYDSTLGELMNSMMVPLDTDCCIIIDSCYSEIVTRSRNESQFAAEVVASVGPDQKSLGNWSNLARVQNGTFTSRLADEIAREVGRGASSVGFEHLIETLRQRSKPDSMPVYHLKAGASGIRIPNLKHLSPSPHMSLTTPQPLRQASVSSPAPSSPGSPSPDMFRPSSSTPDLSVIFRVHLNNVNPAGLEAEQLLDWVRSLSKNLGVELMGVYKSRSTVLLFHAPWSVWANLNGLSGFSFVCEILSRNLPGEIGRRIEAPISGPSQPPLLKENTPFQQNK